MDPMQRSGDFEVEVTDSRLAFYRQSANALAVRMAVLLNMLAVEPGNNGANNI
jgi:aspartate carbamoyltransferase catalytic subunit